MRITIATNGGIISGNMEKVAEKAAIAKNSMNNSADKKISKSNLESVEEFQKLLGHEMEKIDRAAVVEMESSGVTAQEAAAVLKRPVEIKAPEKKTSETESTADNKETNKETIKVPEELKEIFHEAGKKYGVDENLLAAIAWHESRFKTNVTSSSGAMGVMQLMPGTASAMGVKNAYDPKDNINGAARLVGYLLNSFDGDVTLAMAAYSDGMGAVKRAGGVPNTKQAREFVDYINSVYP